jgi:hypothetical protein
MMKHVRLAALFTFVAVITVLLLTACDLLESSSTAARTPEETITEAMRDYLEQQGAPVELMEIEVTQIDGDYARVEIISTDPEAPGGFNAFLKRENDIWTTVLSGSGMEQAQVQALGIPVSVWPEGWLEEEGLMPGVVADAPETASGCPQPTDGTLLFTDELHGYCLLYPNSHTVVQIDSGNTEMVVGELMNHIDPRISVDTEELAGRSMEEVVNEFLAGYEGFEIERTDLTVAGEEAVLLDRIPGQDFYRMVLIPHDGTLYKLQVFPFDENLVDSIAQAEDLYQMAIDSFRFTSQ